MKQSMFNVVKKVAGAKVNFEPRQRELDFLLVGARKACLLDGRSSIQSQQPLFKLFFTSYDVYPEGASLNDYVEPLLLVVKKGTNVSSAVFTDGEVLRYHHAELGKLLGFPPTECEQFDEIQERVFFHYHGLSFACEKSRKQLAIDYLESTFKLPDWMKKEQAFFITE